MHPDPASESGAEPAAALELALPDLAATGRLGAALGAVLKSGDAVMLSGPLGAGKSALARAAIRAMAGQPELEVPSPSYTLANLYETPRGEVWHADLYRLSGVDEAHELGLEEAEILLLEWPERLDGALPPRRLDIALSDAGEARYAVIAPVGPGWEVALASLRPLARAELPA